jgi:hypothetical protein
MIIQVGQLTLCLASTADAAAIRAANALLALRIYWDSSCTAALTSDGRWRASRYDGDVITAGSPAGLHRRPILLTGAVPPLGRRPRGARPPRRIVASWVPGIAGRAGIWP